MEMRDICVSRSWTPLLGELVHYIIRGQPRTLQSLSTALSQIISLMVASKLPVPRGVAFIHKDYQRQPVMGKPCVSGGGVPIPALFLVS